ncbi:terminase large subunit [Salmonella phage 41]|nr:terminase large subunit [Salmonella phage 41]
MSKFVKNSVCLGVDSFDHEIVTDQRNPCKHWCLRLKSVE